jgi:hypothetical protein
LTGPEVELGISTTKYIKVYFVMGMKWIDSISKSEIEIVRMIYDRIKIINANDNVASKGYVALAA